MSNRKVNLLIIGAQKAGTTSLYEYIKQHPDVYFSDVKEVTYFVDDALYSKGEDYYHSFFTKVENEKIIASAYVHMLPCKKCPERVMEYNPEMKFIVMLREPVSRAYSAYNYAVKNGWENDVNSFEYAVVLEKERIENEEYDLMYFENGMYYKHIKHWQNYFPKESFLFIKDTDLKNDACDVLRKIFFFLDIGQVESIDVSKKFNKAGVVRSKLLQEFMLSKNSYIKKMLGSIVPRRVKVWIRANVLKNIYRFNQVDKKYPSLDKDLDKRMRSVFVNDLSNLKKEFNIDFN